MRSLFEFQEKRETIYPRFNQRAIDWVSKLLHSKLLNGKKRNATRLPNRPALFGFYTLPHTKRLQRDIQIF